MTAKRIALALVLAVGCQPPSSADRSGSRDLMIGGVPVFVSFKGVTSGADVFGRGHHLVAALDEGGAVVAEFDPGAIDWLRFAYRVGGFSTEVMIAKQPVATEVSWDDIKRGGATMTAPRPAASIVDDLGRSWRPRLPKCGRSMRADFSEWNLLLGAFSYADPDFGAGNFGWIQHVGASELGLGLGGTLSWCEDGLEKDSVRVARGYFYPSRFHATRSSARTDRLAWRPLLELASAAVPDLEVQAGPIPGVAYVGKLTNEELFGTGRLTDSVRLFDGVMLDAAGPNWHAFELFGQRLLVAERPLMVGISWTSLASVGAVSGDGSVIRIPGDRAIQQNLQVSLQDGKTYRVRLPRCGDSTMDGLSEWNLMIGALHRGDRDFVSPAGQFGWVDPSLGDVELGVGVPIGGATWCMESTMLDGEKYAVNRGFFTVSRYHLTPVDFAGAGFGWRPVLEAVGHD